MKEQLVQLFEALSIEHQEQLLDYAKMLWEMNQSEQDLKAHLGIPPEEEKKAAGFPFNLNPDREIN